MSALQKIFGQRLLQYIIFFVIGVFLIVGPEMEILSTGIGWFIAIIFLFGIIHESKIRYYIKFEKMPKNFKSSGEVFIADYFKKKKIKVKYEKPLPLGSGTIRPDFYLPEFDVYVEYWGKWPGNFDYRRECRDKRNSFKKEGIDLIELYPDNLRSINQLDWKFTERLLRIIKKERS